MKLNVLGPDVNESYYKFTVNDDQCNPFWNGCYKGCRKVELLKLLLRIEKKVNIKSIFDLVKRVDLRAANKKLLKIWF